MVLDRDVVTTGRKQKVILVYGLSNSSNCNVLEGHPVFQVQYFVFVVHYMVSLHLQRFFSSKIVRLSCFMLCAVPRETAVLEPRHMLALLKQLT